jgi:hypothetical protein
MSADLLSPALSAGARGSANCKRCARDETEREAAGWKHAYMALTILMLRWRGRDGIARFAYFAAFPILNRASLWLYRRWLAGAERARRTATKPGHSPNDQAQAADEAKPRVEPN